MQEKRRIGIRFSSTSGVMIPDSWAIASSYDDPYIANRMPEPSSDNRIVATHCFNDK
jgi:hypothetical protein